jgi:hypothetical protein
MRLELGGFFQWTHRWRIKLRPSFISTNIMMLALYVHSYAQPSIHYSYAVFVQSFARYSSWPVSPSGFKVVVVGNTKAYDEIVKSVAGKVIAGSAATVVKNDNDDASIEDASIIYIADGASNQLSQLLKVTDGKPVMIIAEREGLHKKGAAMSFIVINSKLKFDINMKELDKRNLKISAQLTALANNILE